MITPRWISGRKDGFSLVESGIALLIAILLASAVSTTLGVCLRAERASQFRHEAECLVRSISARWWVEGVNAELSGGWTAREEDANDIAGETEVVWRVWTLQAPTRPAVSVSMALRKAGKT